MTIGTDGWTTAEAQEGMTLADYLAAAALPSLIAAVVSSDRPLPRQEIAVAAYDIALAMLAERQRRDLS